MFTPARRRGVEVLDDPSRDIPLAVRSLQDVVKANRLFGGRNAVVRELERLLRHTPQHVAAPLTLLDIGTGLGDIPKVARDAAARQGFVLRTIGLELVPALALAARPACVSSIAGDALRLPFADRSVDFVTCSQVLHHFEPSGATTLLRECTRVARRAVILSDLRRTWFGVAGVWLMSFPLRFHPASRNDGMVSILRGFTALELRELVERATRAAPRVRRAFGSRLTAVWLPSPAPR